MSPASSRQLCLINGVHSIKTRTPSELECSQTNGALCFINPLFFKVHSQDLGGGPRRPCTRTPDADGPEPDLPPLCLQQINQDLNIQLLKDGYRLDEIPDDEDLDLIPPKSVNPTCMCCQATSSTACHIQ